MFHGEIARGSLDLDGYEALARQLGKTHDQARVIAATTDDRLLSALAIGLATATAGQVHSVCRVMERAAGIDHTQKRS